jgi:hypothetical protein
MRGFLSSTVALSAIAIAVGVGACGGASDEPPAPLTRHFDEMYIAAIPVDQQKASFDAQHDWQVSRAENAKAQADLDNANTQLGIARNEVKQAHITVDSAVQAKKSAETSGDMNRINQAQKDLHGAEDGEKAAQARVKFYQLYASFLQRFGRYTAANMYLHEARFEATKAQIAKTSNIAPRGVQYEWFPHQVDERQKRKQLEEHRVAEYKQRALQAHDQWVKIQHQADVETGRQTVAWDPLAGPGATTAGTDQPPPPIQPLPQPPPQQVQSMPPPALPQPQPADANTAPQ